MASICKTRKTELSKSMYFIKLTFNLMIWMEKIEWRLILFFQAKIKRKNSEQVMH